MPFWAARISSGSAARRASAAAARLPEAIASSTLRTKVRTRERRERLIAVRFAILRVIFLADTVLAMGVSSFWHTRCSKRRPEAVAEIGGGQMETEEPAAGAGSSGPAYSRGIPDRQRRSGSAVLKKPGQELPPRICGVEQQPRREGARHRDEERADEPAAKPDGKERADLRADQRRARHREADRPDHRAGRRVEPEAP